jgi:hypothetical protein
MQVSKIDRQKGVYPSIQPRSLDEIDCVGEITLDPVTGEVTGTEADPQTGKKYRARSFNFTKNAFTTNVFDDDFSTLAGSINTSTPCGIDFDFGEPVVCVGAIHMAKTVSRKILSCILSGSKTSWDDTYPSGNAIVTSPELEFIELPDTITALINEQMAGTNTGNTSASDIHDKS